MEGSLDDARPLQAADHEGVGPRTLGLHQLALWNTRPVHTHTHTHSSASASPAQLTFHREVIERSRALIRQLRLLLVAREGPITLQDEVARPPCLYVLTCVTHTQTYTQHTPHTTSEHDVSRRSRHSQESAVPRL